MIEAIFANLSFDNRAHFVKCKKTCYIMRIYVLFPNVYLWKTEQKKLY